MSYPYNSAGEWQYGQPDRMTRYREPMEQRMAPPTIPLAAVESTLKILRSTFTEATFTEQDGRIRFSGVSDVERQAIRFYLLGVASGYLAGELSALQRSA